MTEKTVRRRSVSRRTMLAETAAVMGGAVLRPAPHAVRHVRLPQARDAAFIGGVGYSADEKTKLYSGTAKRVYRLA